VLNRIILIGRLTRDPELRYTPTGNAVASFVLAVDRSFRRANGDRDTDFIPIVAWRGLGETVSQYVEKGRLVAVEGRLQVRTYERKDGSPARSAEVIASAVRFLPDGKSRPKLEEDLEATPGDEPADEVPPS